MISTRMLAHVWVDLITMVSTVTYAASGDRALTEGEAAAFRVAVHSANITARGNHVPLSAGVGIGTRNHVQGKKLK